MNTEPELRITIDGKPSRKHVIKRKLRHLEGALSNKWYAFTDWAAEQGDLALYDALHHTNYLQTVNGKRKQAREQAFKQSYGL